MNLDLWREHQGWTVQELADYLEQQHEITRQWCRHARGLPGRRPRIETQRMIEAKTRGKVKLLDW